jgi:O-antigen ligase
MLLRYDAPERSSDSTASHDETTNNANGSSDWGTADAGSAAEYAATFQESAPLESNDHPAATQNESVRRPVTRRRLQAATQTPPCRLTPSDRLILQLMLFTTSIMPYIPQFDKPLAYPFFVALPVFFLAYVGTRQQSLLSSQHGIILLAFLGVCVFSFSTAMAESTGFGEWFRGVVPFLMLGTFLVMPRLDRPADAAFVIDAFHITCLLWAIRILGEGATVLPGLISGDIGRLTYVVADTQAPYQLIGFTISLFSPTRFATRFRWPLVGGFAFVILACAYRSQFVLAGLLCLVYLGTKKQFVILGVLLFTGGSVLLAAQAIEIPVVSSVLQRFEDSDEKETFGRRGLEIQVAWDAWMEAPVVGRGLGFQLSTSEVAESTSEHEIADKVGYIHNVWMYMLMDLGLLGLATYVAFVVPAFWVSIVRFGDNRFDAMLRFTAAITLTTLLIYTTKQAAFRLVHFNLALAFLMAIIVSRPQQLTRLSQKVA